MIIGLHVNCRSTQDLRRWPYFSELADRLIERGAFIVFTGSEADKPYVQEVISKVKRQDKCVDMTDCFTVNELATLLKVFTLFITVNTLTMHLGVATKTKTLAIIGGTPAEVVAPKSSESFQYVEDPALVKYPKYKPMMDKITVDEVLEVVEGMLA